MSDHQNLPPVMDIKRILDTLPHKYPFVLVDRITQMTPTSITGIKQVTINEQFFQGHFPAQPVMPGVLIVEALAQTAALMLLDKPENKGKIAYLASVDNARFRRMVTPGDTLILKIEAVKLRTKVGIVKAVASVGDQVACEADIMFSFIA